MDDYDLVEKQIRLRVVYHLELLKVEGSATFFQMENGHRPIILTAERGVSLGDQCFRLWTHYPSAFLLPYQSTKLEDMFGTYRYVPWEVVAAHIMTTESEPYVEPTVGTPKWVTPFDPKYRKF